MTSQEFAEKYAGMRVMINNYTRDGIFYQNNYEGKFGKVAGWTFYSNDRIWIRLEESKYNNIPIDAILTIPRESINGLDIRVPMESLMIIEPPKLSNEPDNCLDCGAIGNEVCKERCPNR